MADDLLYHSGHVLILCRVFVDNPGDIERHEGHDDEMPQMRGLFFIKGRSGDFQRDAGRV